MNAIEPVTTTRAAAGSALTDEEVVDRVRKGETALYEILMRRYNQRIYRIARAIVKDDGEAEDVMQQAYVNAYLNLHQFADRASFSTWLTRIAVNEALARAKRRGRAPQSIDSREDEPMEVIDVGAPTPEHQAFAGELRTLVERAIAELPDVYRTVFVLRDVEGLNTEETAECLSISPETAKTRLHRARVILRQRLYEFAGATAPNAFQFHLSRCDRIVESVLARLGQAQ